MTKKIEAIIREEALDAVKDALHAIGIVGMNVVRGARARTAGRHRAGVARHVLSHGSDPEDPDSISS